ncbi:MAG: Asp-tRNA(Asn)/Glu-tRNA(Gln) amidotransferase GatCAB subunit B, partial [Oscillospiraceae bacterium]
ELANTKITPQLLADMIALIENKTISNTAAKIVIEEIINNGTAPKVVVEEKGLAQVSDTSSLENMVEAVLTKNPQTIEQYRNGKTNVLGFLVGQCMRESQGKANPEILKEIILKKLV